jgi:hypothetical protein
MSTESLRRQVADMKAAARASCGPRHILWLPDGVAKLAALRAAGVPDSDIMTVQWLPDCVPEPKSED